MINNATILALSNQKGIENITVHTIPTEHSYKVVKFKQVFNKLMKAYNESREAIVKEVGIKDEQEFNKQLAELEKNKARTDKEEKEYKALLAQQKELNGLTNNLLKEEVKFDGVKTLPYEAWKALQDENKGDDKKADMLTGQIAIVKEINDDGKVRFYTEDVESLLENVLWTMPEEKEENK